MLKKLAQTVMIYLAKGFSEELKESFIFMLKKKGKKNYLLLEAYRPIAIKNILVKLVEKVLIIYIAKKAEAKTLLL